MKRLVGVFTAAVAVFALVAAMTHGYVQPQAASQIDPSQMTIGQHLPATQITDLSLVFE